MVRRGQHGTGTSATSADPGRGKTGTAELGPKPNQPPAKPLARRDPAQARQIIDAWFTCFARPKSRASSRHLRRRRIRRRRHGRRADRPRDPASAL